MSIKNWNGGIIRPVPVAPAGPYQDGAASGVWTLDQVAYWNKQGLWPTAGSTNPADRGIFAGGQNGSIARINVIGYVAISTTGDATDFGDLTLGRYGLSSASSSTRGVFMSGNDNGSNNVIDYVTFSTVGNATDFGDCDPAEIRGAGCSNSTRGLIGGDAAPTIQYITIASTGNTTRCLRFYH